MARVPEMTAQCLLDYICMAKLRHHHLPASAALTVSNETRIDGKPVQTGWHASVCVKRCSAAAESEIKAKVTVKSGALLFLGDDLRTLAHLSCNALGLSFETLYFCCRRCSHAA
jgi:hypothetical protein